MSGHVERGTLVKIIKQVGRSRSTFVLSPAFASRQRYSPI